MVYNSFAKLIKEICFIHESFCYVNLVKHKYGLSSVDNNQYRTSTLAYLQAGLIFRPDEDPKPKEEPLEQLRLEHLILHFILLGVGTTVGVLVFMCELCWGKRE